MHTTTDEQRIREREALADQLYRERYHYLLQIARANGAGDDAPDPVNDAFAAFIDKFDPASGSPPLGWLTLTLQRRCWAIYADLCVMPTLGRKPAYRAEIALRRSA